MSEDEKKDKKEKTLSLKVSTVPSKSTIGSRSRGSSRISTVVVESKRGKISKTRKPSAPKISWGYKESNIKGKGCEGKSSSRGWW